MCEDKSRINFGNVCGNIKYTSFPLTKRNYTKKNNKMWQENNAIFFLDNITHDALIFDNMVGMEKVKMVNIRRNHLLFIEYKI